MFKWKWLLGAMLFCLPAVSQNTQLSGTMVDPAGKPFNGYLRLQLSQQGAALTPLCNSYGAPAQILPNIDVVVKMTNGAMVSPPKVWGADCLNPSGIPYAVNVQDVNGNTLYKDQWLISGTTFDIGTAVSIVNGNINYVPVPGPPGPPGSGGGGAVTAASIDLALNYPQITVYGYSAGDMCVQLTAAETWAQTTQGWKGAVFDARGFRGSQVCAGTEQLFGGVSYTPGNGPGFKAVILLGADLNLVVDNQQVLPGEAMIMGEGGNHIGCGNGCGPNIQVSNVFPANTAVIEYGPNPGAGSTPPEGIYMERVNITCKAPNNSRPQGSIGIQNQFAQENSGAKFIGISYCDIGLDKEGGAGPSNTGSLNDGPWENFHVSLNSQTVNSHCFTYGTTSTVNPVLNGRPIRNWSCNMGTVNTRTVTDAVTNGTTTITSATANFQATGYNTDVGRIVTGTNIPLFTIISAVNSTTSVTVNQAATGSGTNSMVIKVEPNIAGLIDNWGAPQVFDSLHFEGFNIGLEVGSITGARGVIVTDTDLISSQGAFVSSVVDLAQKGRTISDGATTNLTATLTSPSGSFSFADQGATITGAGIPAFTTVISIQSPTSLTMTNNATATASGVSVTFANLSTTGIVLSGLYSGIATYLVNDHGTNGGTISGSSTRQILGSYIRDFNNCVFTSNPGVAVNCSNMVTPSSSTTFTGSNIFTGSTHFQAPVILDALGVASGGPNFGSNVLEPCINYGVGVSNCTGKFSIAPGAGATPTVFWTLNAMTGSGAGANFFDFGNTANPVTPDFYSSPRFYNAAGTFNATFVNPNTVSSYALTMPGFATTLGSGLSSINGVTTFTPGTNITSVVCAASYVCTNTSGRITIVANASATTGTIATVNFSAALSPAPRMCMVIEPGIATPHGLDHAVPTASALVINSATTVASATITAEYVCYP